MTPSHGAAAAPETNGGVRSLDHCIPGLGAMVVLDKDGTIVLDFAERITARRQFCRTANTLNFSVTRRAQRLFTSARPFQARLQQGTWSISISRRLNDADGSFAGIVSGTLQA